MTSDRIDRAVLAWLLGAVALVTLPHATHIPATLFGFFLLMLGWRVATLWNPSSLPGRFVLLGALLIGIGLLAFERQGVVGLEAGTSVFVVALGLKLMELKQSRDLYLLIYLALFVAVTQFLFSQSLLMAVYIFAIVALLIATLIRFNAGPAIGGLLPVKMAMLMLLQAIPLMVVLFILFPRLADPSRFALSFLTPASTITGLADTLEPGLISGLSQSHEVAFRATFDGDLPPLESRYWRGPVFWHSDGTRWIQPSDYTKPSDTTRFSGPAYHYTVMLEPHQRKWLFAMEMPATLPEGAKQNAEHQLFDSKPVNMRKSYSLTSYSHYNTGAISNRERRMGLQWPVEPSERMKQLIVQWRKQNTSDEAVTQAAMRYFREQPFYYTLQPPPLHERPEDTFLFESREGFCEHYATAFVYMMRSAGIPARVVAGYMGGELNSVGNFLEIRQSDAHAWTEVWLEGRGWVRFDPTLAVAPERVEAGVTREILTETETGQVHYRLIEYSAFTNMMRRFRFAWASVDHGWHKWVIHYTSERQSRLYDGLGIDGFIGMIVWLSGGIGLMIVLVAIGLLYKKPPKIERVTAIYRRFCKNLAACGIAKKNSEGAVSYARRASGQRPDLAAAIDRITSLYVHVRYGRSTSESDVIALKQLVSVFRAQRLTAIKLSIAASSESSEINNS